MNLKRMLVVITAFGALFAAEAKAQCGSAPPHAAGQKASLRAAVVWPDVVPAEAKSPEREAAQASESDGPDAPIVGLWRIKFKSGGMIIDDGWDTFHSDGTETLVDTPFGAVCPGLWERTGRLTVKLNHPAFNFNAAGDTVVSVFVYRGQITLDRGGNSFTGTFTWDSYDFQGHLIPSAHVQGTLEGRRVTINSVPFF